MADYKIRERDQVNNRFLKLQDHSKKLEELSFQLISIKNASFRRKFGAICGLCIIENGEIVFKSFIDNETEIAFHLLTNENNFVNKCFNLYHNYKRSAVMEGKYEIFRLIEDTFTLFIKSARHKTHQAAQRPTKYLIFLMRNKQNINKLNQYNLLDLIETIITEMSFKLKDHSENIMANDNNKKDGEAASISNATALIEIAEEVFGGGDDRMSMSAIEFVTAMSVRLGMDNKYRAALENIFYEAHRMFYDEMDSDYSEDSQDIEKCITFNDFVNYFNAQMAVDKHAVNTWNAIKCALCASPLRERNQEIREKEDLSVLHTKHKLYQLEKMVDILDELLIFEYAADETNDEMFWKMRILKHRKVIRLFHDSILYQVLNENERIKKRMNILMKMQYAEMNNNERLITIERKYYSLLKKNKQHQDVMKKCEKQMKAKEDEIYKLKCELIAAREYRNEDTKKRKGHKVNKRVLNDGLLKLKGEIAKKKLNVQKQLNLLSVNIDDNNNMF